MSIDEKVEDLIKKVTEQEKIRKTGDIRACKHLSKLNIKNLEKFEREIQILIKLDHPSIIKLYEVFESERSLYLVMEYCKGGATFLYLQTLKASPEDLLA